MTVREYRLSFNYLTVSVREGSTVDATLFHLSALVKQALSLIHTAAVCIWLDSILSPCKCFEPLMCGIHDMGRAITSS